MAGESRKPALAGDADKVGRHYDKICEMEVSRLETWSPVECDMTLRCLKR